MQTTDVLLHFVQTLGSKHFVSPFVLNIHFSVDLQSQCVFCRNILHILPSSYLS